MSNPNMSKYGATARQPEPTLPEHIPAQQMYADEEPLETQPEQHLIELVAEPEPAVDSTPDANAERRLVVGRNVHFSSSVTGCDLINVYGHVEGEFEASRLMVAESGVFSGKAHVESAEIRGRADGIINVAGTLRLCAGARINGRISYGKLEIEAGAVIEGAVAMGDI